MLSNEDLGKFVGRCRQTIFEMAAEEGLTGEEMISVFTMLLASYIDVSVRDVEHRAHVRKVAKKTIDSGAYEGMLQKHMAN